VIAAGRRADVHLNDSGQLTVQDLTRSVTKANLSIFDATMNTNYSTTRQIGVVGVSINSNNALTVDDPYINFFDQLQSAIDAVLTGKTRASDDGEDPRNRGMQNAITAIDHVFDHLVRKHTQIGSVGNAFQVSADRASTLKINVISVRSTILDTDVGSAYLELNQRSINYQALLSTATKINSLTLVNYMK
jgi:flagellar hook-associated protein 3 FlgL